MHKAVFATMTLALVLLVGCLNERHAAKSEGVVIALNFGIEHKGDLVRLREELAGTGIQCHMGVLDLNYAPILVQAPEATRAQVAAAAITVRDSLTIRLLKSPVPWESPSLFTNSIFEVWESGHLVREEQFKLY